MIVIKHIFPEIGEIEVPLYQESSVLKEDLDCIPSSGIEHLKKLNHLGQLSKILNYGYHSRYEYLVIQLYFINRLAKKSAYGFSSKIKLSQNLTISSQEELMKCWVFLCEFGHLAGTYEAERFWFHQIWSNEILKNTFKKLLVDNKDLQLAFNNVLKNEDLYSFYRILSGIFLNITNTKTLKKLNVDRIETYKVILNKLLIEGKERTRLRRAQLVFERIRKLSYIFLDVSRLPLALNINPIILLQELDKNTNIITDEEGYEFNLLTNHLNEILMEKIYQSSSVNAFKIQKLHASKKRILKNIKKINFYEDDDLLRNKFINGKHNFIIDNNKESTNLNLKHYLRLRYRTDRFSWTKKCLFFSEERFLREKINSEYWKFFVSSYKKEDVTERTLDIYENIDEKYEKEGKLINTIIEYTKSIYEFNTLYDTFESWVVEPVLITLFKNTLLRFIKNDYQVRILAEKESIEEHPSVEFIDSKMDRDYWFKDIYRSSKNQKFSSEKLWEIDCLRRVIKNDKQGKIFVCNSSIYIESINNQKVAEFDGVYFRLYGDNIELTLIEAKSGYSDNGKASTQLAKALKRIGSNESIINNIIQKSKYAYVTIDIKMARNWSF